MTLPAQPPGDIKPAVKVAPVVRQHFAEQFEALGAAKAQQSVDLSSQVTGVIEQMFFNDGEMVQNHQTLVVLDSGEERAQLAIAELEAASHLRELNRLKSLKLTGAAHQASVDSRQTDYDVAVQRIAELQAVVAKYTIKAPFGGLLGLGQFSVGALVRPGDVIVTLDSVQSMELEFTVPETWQTAIATGQSITATADAFGQRTFNGHITAIDSRIDAITRAIRVRARLENAESLLRSGQLMRVVLYSDSRQAFMIPEAALVPRQSRQYIFVLTAGDQVEERAITIGGRRPGEVEVIDGVHVGEFVVYEGMQSLRPGQFVRVIE